MRKTLVLMISVAVCGLAAGTASSSSARPLAVPWYWSPGFCKGNLQSQGMRLSDGRTFNIAKAFCVGRGGAKWCMWSSGRRYRLYGAFTAFARSYDGVVREFDLYTTGRTGYAAKNIKVLASNISPARFNSVVQPYAAALATREQASGCAPYTP